MTDEEVWREMTDNALGLNKKTMNNKAYPKYQYSIFFGDREEQLVIRADTWQEFLNAKRDADQIITKRKGEEPEKEMLVCATCEKPAEHKQGVSKNGKPYSAIFCSSGEKSHAVWIK